MELEKYRAFKQMQLNGLALEHVNLEVEESKVCRLEHNKILDHVKRDTDIDDTISIIGRDTKFNSKYSSQTSGVREIEGYDKHKFSVTYQISLVHSQGKDQSGVHFMTN